MVVTFVLSYCIYTDKADKIYGVIIYKYHVAVLCKINIYMLQFGFALTRALVEDKKCPRGYKHLVSKRAVSFLIYQFNATITL